MGSNSAFQAAHIQFCVDFYSGCSSTWLYTRPWGSQNKEKRRSYFIGILFYLGDRKQTSNYSNRGLTYLVFLYIHKFSCILVLSFTSSLPGTTLNISLCLNVLTCTMGSITVSPAIANIKWKSLCVLLYTGLHT